MTVFKNRADVTAAIVAARVARGLTWKAVAEHIGQSKEWTTSACLGQMTFGAKSAEKIVALFDLDASALPWLQVPPSKGTLDGGAPSDPLLYRWYEIVSVYGPAIKELIHEEFGDGIMSAIDFRLDIEREPHAAGDRVNVTMSGKFLPYKAH
ncbi:cyanase [Gluconacetobacter sacchari]|uniref:Cyanate hydratase n=2 Tax=Gluconacetobacter sacchari TaxID=92759 RepID=A0A7W4IH29_9PROT|nr:cyanase [Gluconacetobacter sacchari]MBB2162682.1 cyanase [Gluconacetobacter sacchari]GBQ24833.1 cyanate lyase [Gluconacetobacter sacchari DSM 12717]